MRSATYVDLEGLRRIWPAFAAMSCRLDDLSAGLRSVLVREDGCWGCDETGTTFARSYVGAAAQADRALQAVATMVGDISTALRVTADNADACEHRVQGRYR
jgi:hypothetical protein